MGIFKKADAEIRVRVTRKGEDIENMLESYGKSVELWSGFEAICRGLLNRAKKQEGEVTAAVFADRMENALRRSVEAEGIQNLDEMLKEAMAGIAKELEEAQKESGEADA